VRTLKTVKMVDPKSNWFLWRPEAGESTKISFCGAGES
jgi:hypothetical protein